MPKELVRDWRWLWLRKKWRAYNGVAKFPAGGGR